MQSEWTYQLYRPGPVNQYVCMGDHRCVMILVFGWIGARRRAATRRLREQKRKVTSIFDKLPPSPEVFA